MAKNRPVVLVTGARQTGKSSILQHIFADLPYVTSDHRHQTELANENPDYSIQSFPGPIVLDEIRYAPNFFDLSKVNG